MAGLAHPTGLIERMIPPQPIAPMTLIAAARTNADAGPGAAIAIIVRVVGFMRLGWSRRISQQRARTSDVR
jgi:hypothetical protein